MRHAPRKRLFYAALCGLAMVATGIAALAWWRASWITVALLALGVACVATFVYAWLLARRVFPTVEGPVQSTRGMLMDWAAPVYDAYCPLLGLGRRFRRETLRHAAISPGEQVLDVGCGTGVLTRLAAEAVGPTGRMVGIDPGSAMIAVARREAIRAASRTEFGLAAIERLPFPDASFDLVLSSFMLHHLPPEVKRAGLSEVYRVLKPGGRLLAVDVDRPANPFWWLVAWPLLFMSYTAPNLRGEVPVYLRAAGFGPVDVRARKGGLLTFWWAGKPSKLPGGGT